MTMIEYPAIGANTQIELKQNMVFSFHPQVVDQDGQVCLYTQDTYRVGKSEGECLANVPWKFFYSPGSKRAEKRMSMKIASWAVERWAAFSPRTWRVPGCRSVCLRRLRGTCRAITQADCGSRSGRIHCAAAGNDRSGRDSRVRFRNRGHQEHPHSAAIEQTAHFSASQRGMFGAERRRQRGDSRGASDAT